MLLSEGIAKLEAKKGFKCNHLCDTCVCDKAHKSVLNQIEVYDEIYKQGVISDKKYIKEVYEIKKEAVALARCCDRLNEDFHNMVDIKVEEYCDINDKRLKFDEMSDEVYEGVILAIEESYIAEYTGGDRYAINK